MSYLFASVTALTLLSVEPVFALGFEHCQGEADAVMQAYGGQDLKLSSDGVTGWGVNASGYVSYTFTRGDQECYVSYFLKGTYMGELCSENRYGSPEIAACGKLKTWSKSRRGRNHD